MSVITISREFGSEGDAIAAAAAQALGYHLVDKELIKTLLGQYGLVEFDKEFDVLPGFWERFNAQREQRREQTVKMLNQVVRALAQHGNVVIVGRSGFAILQDLADVLNVRIQTPLATRIDRVMAQQELSAEHAELAVKDGDKARTAFIESFYGVKWDSASAFDLVIDTSKIPPAIAAEWLIQAGHEMNASASSGQLARSALEVDPILASAVSETLRCNESHS